MRKFSILLGLVVVGIGIASWSTLGKAQTSDQPPIPERFTDPVTPPKLPEPEFPTKKLAENNKATPIRPAPKPRPVDDPFIDPLPPATSTTTIKAFDSDPVPPVHGNGKVTTQQRRTDPVVLPMAPASQLPEIKAPENDFPLRKEPIIKEATLKELAAPERLPGIDQPTSTKAYSIKSAAAEHTIMKQEPSVALEWKGPSALRVGTPAEYTLIVRNTCALSVQKVVVQVRVPTGVKLQGTEPKADGTEDVLLWDLGTVASKQEKVLKMLFVPPSKGEINCQAWVTFTGSAAMKIQVREPKLLVKTQAPDKVIVGEPANILLSVSNPGDYPAEKIKLNVTLAEGLECARGKKATFDLGTLDAGETRQVTIPCIAKSPGKQQCDAVVEGELGLTATDSASISIIQASIDIDITGPKVRYLDKKGTYACKVTNPTDMTATNVFITQVIPAGLKFVSADQGGQHDSATRTVKWFIGELGSGQTKEVKTELVATETGEYTHKIHVSAARGIKTDKELVTKVEGVSALLMELVDTEDPIELKTETTYEIRITNTGSKLETDVKLACIIPAQMKFKSATGPVKHNVVGNEIVFDTIPKLAPRVDATFKITVVGTEKGDARFKAALTSGGLTQPVIKEESTRVYSE